MGLPIGSKVGFRISLFRISDLGWGFHRDVSGKDLSACGCHPMITVIT